MFSFLHVVTYLWKLQSNDKNLVCISANDQSVSYWQICNYMKNWQSCFCNFLYTVLLGVKSNCLIILFLGLTRQVFPFRSCNKLSIKMTFPVYGGPVMLPVTCFYFFCYRLISIRFKVSNTYLTHLDFIVAVLF